MSTGGDRAPARGYGHRQQNHRTCGDPGARTPGPPTTNPTTPGGGPTRSGGTSRQRAYRPHLDGLTPYVRTVPLMAEPIHSRSPRRYGPEVSVPIDLLASGLPMDAVRLWLIVRTAAGGDDLPAHGFTRSALAGRLEVSRDSVKRYLRLLQGAGYLKVEHRQNRSSIFTATQPRPW